MSTLQNVVTACQADETQLKLQAQARTKSWDRWTAPVSGSHPTGEDPGYDDNFQRIREEVNKLSGIDTALICQLAEKLLTTAAQDTGAGGQHLLARCQSSLTGFAVVYPPGTDEIGAGCTG
ncbi:hypothetical protein [Candidatus Pantoea floridensis]|uniref:Uncharacterized protein n=1 Tax=Candidatus Pantoea floridensis TaxID=1938870 RepID=A0A286BT97_9GAMM|nr:hypothetical protein BX596_3400 [Enterobacteriaceae bacterium JKS000233]SOD37369.1 hypothetical protein SAMN06273570_1722 [Pantoea floridensis]